MSGPVRTIAGVAVAVVVIWAGARVVGLDFALAPSLALTVIATALATLLQRRSSRSR